VLELDALVSRVWPLEEIEDALEAVRRGEVLRAVLSLGPGREPSRPAAAR
jgi:Zn-dependent alcohol dehydrogenase